MKEQWNIRRKLAYQYNDKGVLKMHGFFVAIGNAMWEVAEYSSCFYDGGTKARGMVMYHSHH
jgi:hypothetical protein